MTSETIKILNPGIIQILMTEFSVSPSTIYDSLKERRSYGRTPLIRKRAIELAIYDHKRQIQELRAIKD